MRKNDWAPVYERLRPFFEVLKYLAALVFGITRIAQECKRCLGQVFHLDPAGGSCCLVGIARLVLLHLPVAALNLIENRTKQPTDAYFLRVLVRSSYCFLGQSI